MRVECEIDNHYNGNNNYPKVIVSNVFTDKDMVNIAIGNMVSIVIGNEVAEVNGTELVSAIRKCIEGVNHI